jgi:hypothetical protein
MHVSKDSMWWVEEEIFWVGMGSEHTLECMMALDWTLLHTSPQVLWMFFFLTITSSSLSFSHGLFCLFPACTYVVPAQVPLMSTNFRALGHYQSMAASYKHFLLCSCPFTWSLHNVTTQIGSLFSSPCPFILSWHLRWNICTPWLPNINLSLYWSIASSWKKNSDPPTSLYIYRHHITMWQIKLPLAFYMMATILWIQNI